MMLEGLGQPAVPGADPPLFKDGAQLKEGKRSGVRSQPFPDGLTDVQTPEIFLAIEEPFREQLGQGTPAPLDLQEEIGFNRRDLGFPKLSALSDVIENRPHGAIGRLRPMTGFLLDHRVEHGIG